MRRTRSRHFGAGVTASLSAEAVFVGLVAVVALGRGTDPWKIVRLPAAFLVGPSAVQPPGFLPGDILLGLFLHVALGVLVGWLYALLLPRLGLAPIVGGLVAGALLYVLGFWVLPQIFPEQLQPFWLPPDGRALQAAAHAIYGLVFGATFARLTRTA